MIKLPKPNMHQPVFQLLLCIAIFLFISTSDLSAKRGTFYSGFSVGVIPAGHESVWLDSDINRWADREPSFIYAINGGYRLSGYSKAGIYFEHELANIELEGAGKESLSRLTGGLQWMGNYPDTPIQWQFGGYSGIGVASYSEGTAKFFGQDNGIITGPAYEKDKLGIALHLHAGFGWYSGNDIPDGISVHDPRIFLKAYYIF